MPAEMELLILATITISVLHTITGPDHYLPFIALSKARGWTVGKTIWWTLLCGCGHVWSSVLLGLGGAAVGWSLSSIKWMETLRGGIAGWMLLGFGGAYCLWGLIKAGKGSRHKHFESYEDGEIYVYEHGHGEAVAPKERHRVTPWVLFLIFVLGPCEPMIPLLYFPAAKASWVGMVTLVLIYTFFTLAIMVAMVLAGYYGTSFLKTERLEKYMHAVSGATIFICGAGMVFMNW
jgi:hypothetical protein